MPERATGTTSRTVAIQGERGSFSHAAVLELLGTDWMPQPHPTFDGAFQAVASGKAERALIPVENSLAGSIHENYDRYNQFTEREVLPRLSHGPDAFYGADGKLPPMFRVHMDLESEFASDLRRLGKMAHDLRLRLEALSK